MIVRAVLALSLFAGALMFQPTGPARADNYPSKPIKMVVPFPPGGPTDGLARIISDRLGAVLGQSVIIENKGGGAGGSVGAKVVAAAEPDGYTILITPGGSLTTGPAVHTNIGYDPAKAFTPVALLMTAPMIMTVHPSLPVKTFPELIAYAKANPGKITGGSQGYGTAPHLLLEMMKLDYGLNILHVPYRGSAPAITALLGGEIQLFTDASTTILPHIQSGKARAIAVLTPQRIKPLPDVPTTAEQGYAKLQTDFWLGVAAPGGTPPEIISKLNAALRESLAAPQTRAQLANFGADVAIGTPEEFGKMLTKELALWTGVAKAAHLQME